MSEAVEGHPTGRVWNGAWRYPRRRHSVWEEREARLPPLGIRVGGYRLEARLGEGGQGTVYRARRGGRLYAVKFISLAMEEWAWRELEVRLRLRRVGEVKLEGCGQWPDRAPRFLFIAMPYVRGRPVEQWAREKNPTAREVVLLLREVARQLVPVHAAGVVHRDIKCANVLVRRGSHQPVLVDFGVGTYPGAPEITSPLVLPGTRHYRSPEMLRFRRQWAGTRRYRASALDDLWALGVLLYWLLTGSYPFEVDEEDEGALADVILRGQPEPPHVRNPRVPRALSELCLRLLEKSPEARYPSAEALGEALEAVLAEADGAWNVALGEAWGPEDATTPQHEALGLGDEWARVLRLRAYARLHPRRGRPIPLEEASTLPTSEVTPERTRAPPRRVLAWGGAVLTLGLVAGLAASRTTYEVASAPTMLEVTNSGQEVARLEMPPEGDGGVAPSRAATPAPVASATPRKDSTRVKTPQQAPVHQEKKQQSVFDSALRTCTWVWIAGQLACVSTTEQVRIVQSMPPPPPAECPPGSLEAMRELGIHPWGMTDIKSIEFHLDPDDRSKFITVRIGPGITVRQLGAWGKLPMGTVISGELFSGDGRVYGRFTQAHHPDGHTYPVCMELTNRVHELGVEKEPGSGQDTVRISCVQILRAVKRFK
jgi:serine/threonine-protein kinase